MSEKTELAKLSGLTPDDGKITVYTPGAKITKLSELVPDIHNANAGTGRGTYMLDYSVRNLGAGRGILIDKEGRIIAGNKTVEALAAIGIDDVIIVETDGTKIVATKRTDLDLLTDEEARLMAYADNRVSEVGFELDLTTFKLDIDEGIDLSGLFTELEIGENLDGDGLNIIDDGELAPPHPSRGGESPTSIVVGFGRFAAPLDSDTAGAAIRALKARWGDDPEVALIALCEMIINENFSS